MSVVKAPRDYEVDKTQCCCGNASVYSPVADRHEKVGGSCAATPSLHRQEEQRTRDASCPPLGSGQGIVTARPSALIGAKSASLLHREMLADVRFGSLADKLGRS